MGPIGCPETSVRNYNYSLRNNSEEGGTQLLSGGSLKSRNRVLFWAEIATWPASVFIVSQFRYDLSAYGDTSVLFTAGRCLHGKNSFLTF